MTPDHWFIASLVMLMMENVVRSQISWTPIYVDTSNRVDLWTVSSTGCECPNGKSSLQCACCVKPGGCLCPSNPNKCAQCGLEDSCQKSCNTTISAKAVATRSGLSWVQLISPELEGPTSCFWRLHSAPGQRIEVQIHRIIAVGSFDNSTQTCKDGFLQFTDGDTTSTPSTEAIQLCGQNSRFSPPVVIFGDQGVATLYLQIESKSTRSQVLAYVSFSSADDPNVGNPSRGGKLRPHSACDWTYDNCKDAECILSSPGYPGLFPPFRICRYFITTNSTTDKILIRFQSLNIPPPPLCSTHHIAIWKKDGSNLATLGPPWKTLCQHSENYVEVDGGQALIEFRSGFTTSPNLYNGFRASVTFQPATTTLSKPKPSRGFGTPTTEEPKRNVSATKGSSTSSMGRLDKGKGGSRDREGRLKNEAPLLGHVISEETRSSPKSPTISCGHVFNGNEVREESFRLKLPKDSGGRKGGSRRGGDFSRNPQSQSQCRLEFRGKRNDVVLLALSNYKLRGSNCSSQLHIHDLLEEEEDEDEDREWNGTTTTSSVPLPLSTKLCGPTNNGVKRFTSTSNKMGVVVIPSPYEGPMGAEIVEGAFKFHDESIEGTAKPQSNCEVVFHGMTSSPSGSLVTTGPSSSSPLLRLSPLPLECSYSFHPALNQSVLLTLLNVSSTGHNNASTTTNYNPIPQPQQPCRTVCSTSGCYCDAQLPIEEIDHFSVSSGSTEIACFCGTFADLLPVVFESDSSLNLVAHYVTKKVLGNYTVTYTFTPNTSRYTNFTIFPPSGWKRWKEIIPGQAITARGMNAYKVYDYTWLAHIPVRMKLTVDLVSEENERDCKVWNLTVWAEDDKLLNRSYLLSSFCPVEGRKEVKVPDPVRIAFIRLQGVSIRVPQFEVRWKYHDASSLSANRLPEKMMSDTANRGGSSKVKVSSSCQQGIISLVGVSFVIKFILFKLQG